MAPRGNNMIPNVHFHKKWFKRVKYSFNQPFRNVRRSMKRLSKARKIAPKPLKGPLRPIVHCPSVRYNSKLRAGRGFTLNEIHLAGMRPEYARSIGIAVDHRRRNKSIEMIQRNVQRLKEYRQKLILLPHNRGKKLKKVASQIKLPTIATNDRITVPSVGRKFRKEITDVSKVVRQINLNNEFPFKSNKRRLVVQKVTKTMMKFQAYQTLRQLRNEAKFRNKKKYFKDEGNTINE